MGHIGLVFHAVSIAPHASVYVGRSGTSIRSGGLGTSCSSDDEEEHFPAYSHYAWLLDGNRWDDGAQYGVIKLAQHACFLRQMISMSAKF